MKLRKTLTAAALAVGLAIWSLALTGPAHAQFEVEQPEIEKGAFELEYHGGAFFGRPSMPVEAARQGHEFEAFYGLTDWLQIKGTAELEQERAEDGSFDSLKLSAIETQSKFGLIPLEGDGLGASFLAAYGESVVSGEDESSLTFGPILKAAHGPLSVTANLFPVYLFDIKETELAFEEGEAEIEVARTPDHWNLDYAWLVRHQTTQQWAFGVEGFGGFEDIAGNVTDGEPDKHRLGPVVYLGLGDHGRGAGGHDNGHDLAEPGLPEMEIAFGVLFGLNDDTSDVALKWDVEIEF